MAMAQSTPSVPSSCAPPSGDVTMTKRKHCSFESLPTEVLTTCFNRLTTKGLLPLLATSRRIRSVVIELAQSRFSCVLVLMKDLHYVISIELGRPSDFSITYNSNLQFSHFYQPNSTASSYQPLPVACFHISPNIILDVPDPDDQTFHLDFFMIPGFHNGGRIRGPLHDSVHQFLGDPELRDLKLYENLCSLENSELVVEPEGLIIKSEKFKSNSFILKIADLHVLKFLILVKS